MNPKPATLVILTPGFPADEQDTACLPPQQVFVRALNKNFPELRVVIVSFRYPHRIDSYSWYGNTVISLDGWKKGRWNKVVTMRAIWRRLIQLRKKANVVGLLSFWCGPCALVGKYFGKWMGWRHFTWILGQDAKAGNQFISLIRPEAGELVAMSDFLAEEFQRNYGVRPAFVVPNGIDTSFFGEDDQEDTRDIDVLGVGNLIPLKQYDLFVSVVSELSDRLPGVRGLIYGKGEERERLQQMIGELELRDNLRLAGEQPHVEVLRQMRRSKILLHTSSYEGFGTVCIEALYAGAHVISFIETAGRPVKNWHIVRSKEEMAAKALELLQASDTVYEPVLPFTMEESARAMMDLYGYKDMAMS